MNTSSFQHAYVLHTRPYRETSLLVDLFVAELGRVTAVMRGARRKGVNVAQVFQPVMVELSGSGELKNIKSIEPAGQLTFLTGNALLSGFYINELLVRLLPKDIQSNELFLAYVAALGGLAENKELEPLLRHFEMTLLDVLGYAINFDAEAESELPIRSEELYEFQPQLGFIYARFSSKEVIRGEVIHELASGRVESVEAKRASKRILRAALAIHLGNKPLKSRELFSVSQKRT